MKTNTARTRRGYPTAQDAMRAAHAVCPRTYEIDTFANTAEDYAQELTIKAWEAKQRKHRGPGYCHATIHNAVTSYRRRAKPPAPLELFDIPEPGRNVEEVVADRGCVALLEKRLSRHQWEILVRFAVLGERAPQAYGVGRSALYERLQKARTAARQVLEEDDHVRN